MMGSHHAACGAAAWVAITTQFHVDISLLTEKLGWGSHGFDIGMGLLDISPVGVITGALVTAGAALLPDADHHNATIAHSLPPLSNAMCAAVGKVSGGHRHGTHSIIGIIVFVAVAWVAGLWTIETDWFGTIFPGAGILSVLLVSFAAKALKIIPDRMRKSPWAVGLTVGLFIALFAPEEQFWFPLSMGVGVIVHILGDMMTTGGCNLAWPFTIKPPKAWQNIPVLKDCWKKNGYLAVPVLGNAGSSREWLLLIPIGLYAVIGVGATMVGMGRDGLSSLVAAAGLG
ncbi:metal-dependent hydrolase [Arthrobacter sp. zg-Y1110]|uniref:metal-dependent hydrolase n=1 Tax=Arthrobacter sp. zg-Y1110 TaxID=2886932 RepID=UPI001D14BC81|nr:metal-dependent hydrolase [Arthrobacter sp. zg-Y1110]MCC3292990.1 metal-dependent hydrolase [Arthrobacter sp. zg-Y1110]UWX86929.1 metal-dependent hydrolase [Arthrobacter sp. zg-Y1110]